MTVRIERQIAVRKLRLLDEAGQHQMAAAGIQLGVRLLKGVRISRIATGERKRRGGFLVEMSRRKFVRALRLIRTDGRRSAV